MGRLRGDNGVIMAGTEEFGGTRREEKEIEVRELTGFSPGMGRQEARDT